MPKDKNTIEIEIENIVYSHIITRNIHTIVCLMEYTRRLLPLLTLDRPYCLRPETIIELRVDNSTCRRLYQ